MLNEKNIILTQIGAELSPFLLLTSDLENVGQLSFIDCIFPLTSSSLYIKDVVASADKLPNILDESNIKLIRNILVVS